MAATPIKAPLLGRWLPVCEAGTQTVHGKAAITGGDACSLAPIAGCDCPFSDQYTHTLSSLTATVAGRLCESL